MVISYINTILYDKLLVKTAGHPLKLNLKQHKDYKSSSSLQPTINNILILPIALASYRINVPDGSRWYLEKNRLKYRTLQKTLKTQEILGNIKLTYNWGPLSSIPPKSNATPNGRLYIDRRISLRFVWYISNPLSEYNEPTSTLSIMSKTVCKVVHTRVLLCRHFTSYNITNYNKNTNHCTRSGIVITKFQS